MSRADYYSKYTDWRWKLPTKLMGQSWTFGFWIKRTTDALLQFESSTDLNDYIYEPLDTSMNEIRLLELQPGVSSEPLRGHLIHVPYRDCPPYETLSYVWGPLHMSNRLSLDQGSVQVTDSLVDALVHIRSETQTRMLWCDQLCINQHDSMERSQQVSIMLEIYAYSKSVIVWLGQSTEATGAGMGVLEGLVHRNENAAEEPYWLRLPPREISAGIGDIMTRHWWQRMWTLQEAAVAKEIEFRCGPHSFRWDVTFANVRPFVRAIKSAVVDPRWDAAGFGTIDMDPFIQLLNMQLESGPYRKMHIKPDMLDIRYDTRRRVAADPRDKLYALLGLATRMGIPLIRPDYTKPVEDVFADFERLVLRTDSARDFRDSDTDEDTAEREELDLGPLQAHDLSDRIQAFEKSQIM